MIISIQRFEFGDKYTIGKLYLDGVFECYTLEDKVREIKIPKETAIPAGSYKVIIDHSNRFGRDLPHILDVPDFEGVRIHSGNTDKDTEGCILVGKSHAVDFVSDSRKTFDILFEKIKDQENLQLFIM
jgi:hypothetical protein